MKAVIYAGIGLFSVASVYGVTDYYQTNKSGVLKNLYQETTAADTKEIERTINAEEYSRGKISEPVVAANETEQEIRSINTIATTKKRATKVRKTAKVTSVIEDDSKINLKSFSRARLVVKKDTLTTAESALFDE